MKTYTIDASGQKIGRVASQIAHVLQGKHESSYTPHEPWNGTVIVQNINAIDIDGRLDETFVRYSGYPGGQTIETLESLKDRKSVGEVLLKIVSGMLPKNTHRQRLLRQITIS